MIDPLLLSFGPNSSWRGGVDRRRVRRSEDETRLAGPPSACPTASHRHGPTRRSRSKCTSTLPWITWTRRKRRQSGSGARRAAEQLAPDRYRVLLDPPVTRSACRPRSPNSPSNSPALATGRRAVQCSSARRPIRTCREPRDFVESRAFPLSHGRPWSGRPRLGIGPTGRAGFFDGSLDVTAPTGLTTLALRVGAGRVPARPSPRQ